MRKICITLLLLVTFQLAVPAMDSYPGESIVREIGIAYEKANPRKMEKLWNELCNVNTLVCEAGQDKFNNLLANAKLRRQERNRQIWLGVAAGASVVGSALSNSTTQQIPWTFNMDGQMVGPGIYTPPAYNVYNSYGQRVGRITPY